MSNSTDTKIHNQLKELIGYECGLWYFHIKITICLACNNRAKRCFR